MGNDFYCVPLKIPNNPFTGVKPLLTVYTILIIYGHKKNMFSYTNALVTVTNWDNRFRN